MESLSKLRKSARIWVSRDVNRLRNVLSTEPDVMDIESCLIELDKKVKKLESVQEQIEIEIDEDDLENSILEADEFLEQVRQVRREATIASRDLCDLNRATVTERQLEDNKFGLPTPNLPKLHIQNFDGNFLEWFSFKEKFQSLIGNTGMADISKFSYLQSLLVCDAKRAIEGLALTGDNYEIAMEILENRFGRKERIIFEHIQKLFNINFQSSKGNIRSFWNTYHELQSNIRSLGTLGVDGANFGVVLTPLILSRLPSDIRLLWARQSHGKEADLKFLMHFLELEIETRERSETYRGSEKGEARSTNWHNKPSAAALQSTTRKEPCVFCQKLHPSEKCWNVKTMSPDDVRRIASKFRLCFRCFRNTHQAKNCRVNCRNCGGRHNESLCINSEITSTKDDRKCDDYHGDNVSCDLRTKSVSVATTPTSGVSEEHKVMSADRDCVSVRNQNDVCRNDNVHYHSSPLLHKTTVMQTVSVVVNGQRCTLLFDSGSDKSYITSSLVKKIRPTYLGREQVSEICFGETGPRNPVTRNNFEINCSSIDNGDQKKLTVTEIPKITAPMFRAKIPSKFIHDFDVLGPDSVKLTKRFSNDENLIIDILIGLDYYWSLMNENIVRTQNGLVLQESVFGWVLSGNYPSVTPLDRNCQNLCTCELSDSLIRSFWEVESTGIVETEESKAMESMPDSFHFRFDKVIGRYEVDLPWKTDKKDSLLDNYDQASLRLKSLERKMKQNPGIQRQYDLVLEDLENQEIVEEVPFDEVEVTGQPVFYLPHRPVVKESSTTTKVRPVFDASAVGPTGVSLNSCMETGPYLTGNLLDVLLRFRRWRYALVSDITKAFFQIQVSRADRDVHRFLWKQNERVRIMRITRVPFGNTSSPFLLNATIKHHLSLQESSRVVQELLTNIYVDDWLTGADTLQEVVEMKVEGKAIMERAKMHLTKWCSNDPSVADQDIQVLSTKETEVDPHKVLGVLWVPGQDCFTFAGMEKIPDNLIITKRTVLSYVSRVFDPFGFLQPFVMTAKMIFQGLWKLGLQWDDKLPEEEGNKFIRWMNDLSNIKDFSVPRRFVNQSWTNKRSLELHVFSDASEKAYGACVYMKVVEEGGCVNISFVIAKGKLAPIKKVTLPRLELLGALLGARLISYVKKTLFLLETTHCYCWTDSTVVLSWIKSEASRWKTFVANRVTEIQELTSPDSWHHCPGLHNPADVLSRGAYMETLLTSQLWFTGPQWLKGSLSLEHKNNEKEISENVNNDVMDDEKCNQSAQMKVETRIVSVFPVERWGDFAKSVRVCAYVFRFIRNLMIPKTERQMGCLTTNEINTASVMLLKDTQVQYFGNEIEHVKSGKLVNRASPLFKLKPFIDEKGLMRVKGRLQLSDLSYAEKHPVILPKCHLSFLLTRREHKTLNHTGVSQMITSLRNRYWIVGLRSIAKQVKRECVACCRHDSRLSSQEPSPLPRQRIEQANPYSVIGIDYAGPLYSSDCVGKKHYVLLFTCAVIRAVHIELVDSLSLSDFSLAFKRFCARRGMPNIIMSDNAKTFKAAAKALVDEHSNESPKWHFITPRAPWCGGFWERLIKSIKLSLKKTIGLKCQTRCELETTLFQIEACINSRPLTGVYDEVDSMEPLTPHFLLGRGDSHRPASNIPTTSTFDPGQCLRTMLKQKNIQLLRFWDIWHKEYLRNLTQIKYLSSNKMVQKGTLCPVKEDNLTRLYWPIGKILEIFPGKDNIIRTVKVKTAKGTIVRPLGKIYLLELLGDSDVQVPLGGPVDATCIENDKTNTGGSESSQDQNIPDSTYVTRAGRKVKKNKRFNNYV